MSYIISYLPFINFLCFVAEANDTFTQLVLHLNLLLCVMGLEPKSYTCSARGLEPLVLHLTLMISFMLCICVIIIIHILSHTYTFISELKTHLLLDYQPWMNSLRSHAMYHRTIHRKDTLKLTLNLTYVLNFFQLTTH
jgi:hypothetical protein